MMARHGEWPGGKEPFFRGNSGHFGAGAHGATETSFHARYCAGGRRVAAVVVEARVARAIERWRHGVARWAYCVRGRRIRRDEEHQR